MTQVLDYRPPLADRPLTRLGARILLPMSPRWRTLVSAAALGVLWGGAWLPGAGIVELTCWFVLAVWVVCALGRRHARWYVRCTRGIAASDVPEADSERFTRRQTAVVALAVSALFYPWPLVLGLCVQRPLLERFAWRAYAEVPMLDPPSTPRMVGWYVVTGVRAGPTGVSIRVLGTPEELDYTPPDRERAWERERSPWPLRLLTPIEAGVWQVDSSSYGSRCG